MLESLEICRLCLQNKTNEEELNEIKIEEIQDVLSKLTPFVNKFDFDTQDLCDSCIHNFKTSKSLILKVKRSENKIMECFDRNKTEKADITKLHEELIPVSKRLIRCSAVCRLCLNCIQQSRIFLCESNYNILDHTMLRDMMEYCNLFINVNLTEKPTVCLTCWQHLLVTYTFKKYIVETEKRIRIYSKKNNLDVDKNMLSAIKDFLIDEQDDTSEESEKESDDNEDSTMDRIQFEHSYIRNPIETKPKVSRKLGRRQKRITPTKRTRQFSRKEDLLLLQSYFEVTNNETKFRKGYWKKIGNKWQQKIGKKENIHTCSLQNRLSNILRNELYSVEEISNLKSDAKIKNKHDNLEAIKKVHDIGRMVHKKRKHNKSENDTNTKNDTKIAKVNFSRDEDLALLMAYFEVTDNGKIFTYGYWNKICDIWSKKSGSNKRMSISVLKSRYKSIIRHKLISNEDILKIKSIVSKNKKKSFEISPMVHDNQTGGDTTRNSVDPTDLWENIIRIKDEPMSDSDDTFSENEATSSFTPHIKTEPLIDSDSEIDVESQIERLPKTSHWDSLPQLERMDIPPMTIKIGEIYSVDNKRASMIELDLDPNVSVEEFKTCRKLSIKNQNDDGLFKCLLCNFKSKCRRSVNMHARRHGKGRHRKKLFSCKICPYKISNVRLFKMHEKLHETEEDLPVLLPMCDILDR